MLDLLRPALVISLRKLPTIVSLIEENELTSPVAFDEAPVNTDGVISTKLIIGIVDLYGLMNEHYPEEIALFTAMNSHCEKTLYLLTEGELRVFLPSKEALAMKRINDTLRDAGVSATVREKVMDAITAEEDTTFEWLDAGDTISTIGDIVVEIPTSWIPDPIATESSAASPSSTSTATEPAVSTVQLPNLSTWTPASSSFGVAHTPVAKPVETVQTTTPAPVVATNASLFKQVVAIIEGKLEVTSAEGALLNEIMANPAGAYSGLERLMVQNLFNKL